MSRRCSHRIRNGRAPTTRTVRSRWKLVASCSTASYQTRSRSAARTSRSLAPAPSPRTARATLSCPCRPDHLGSRTSPARKDTSMRSSTRTRHVLLLALRLAVAPAAAIGGSLPAFAVDNMNSSDAPDLASVRAKIKAADYKGALTELKVLADTNQ